MRPRLILTLLLLSPLVCLAQGAKGSADRDQPLRSPFDGAKIFQGHCATCHGPDGRGHGPAAVALKQALPDLTLISRRNKGKFPFQHVRTLIEGTAPGPLAHGIPEMPIWGPIFHEVEADQDWGEVRLDAVTRHLESIQQ